MWKPQGSSWDSNQRPSDYIFTTEPLDPQDPQQRSISKSAYSSHARSLSWLQPFFFLPQSDTLLYFWMEIPHRWGCGPGVDWLYKHIARADTLAIHSPNLWLNLSPNYFPTNYLPTNCCQTAGISLGLWHGCHKQICLHFSVMSPVARW